MWFVPYTLSAQKPSQSAAQYSFKLVPLDNEKSFLKKIGVSVEMQGLDSSRISKLLQQAVRQLHAKAYLAASIDTVFWDSKKCTAYLFVGEQYKWASLVNGNVAPAFLDAIAYKERLYSFQAFSYKEVVQLQQKLLTYLENNGYPFAAVYLDSIRIQHQQVSAALYCNKGPLIYFDELEVEHRFRKANKNKKKKKVIQEGYLSAYLSVKEGKLYNEKTIQKIQKRLSSLRYLSSFQNPSLVFIDNQASLNLFLQARPSSKIDVLFGFIPSKDPVSGQQKYDFTGNIDIDLVNPFATGKRLRFKWQQIKAGTSDLLVGFQWPYLLKTPIGLDLAFKLYKRDSSYIDIISDVGIQYLFNGNSYIQAFFTNTTTNLININAEAVLATRQLPSMLDINNASFGIEFYYETLDYLFNPKKGFETKLTASFALKNIRKNNRIESLIDPQDSSFNFAALYDTVNLGTYQYRFALQHHHFFQLWKWSTLKTGLVSGLIYSEAPIYDNETYRIGGNRLLRGFDEESIFATWYNVLTLEWRFLFGKNSYAYLFGDFSYIQNNSISGFEDDFPIGFGLGVALETKVGIFGLSYALGTKQGNPILFNNSKVHFGYIYAF